LGEVAVLRRALMGWEWTRLNGWFEKKTVQEEEAKITIPKNGGGKSWRGPETRDRRERGICFKVLLFKGHHQIN